MKPAKDCCFWNLFFHQDCPFDNLHFRLKLGHVCFSLRFSIIHGLICQFSIHYYWYYYNQKQSYGDVLQKIGSYIFHKFHKKTPALKTRFYGRCSSTEFNPIKKDIPAQMVFFVNCAKFIITPFLKNPSDGCFCINTHSVYFPSTTLHLFKNVLRHVFRLSIFSA